jgi:very-short-patch-repair endonuclease
MKWDWKNKSVSRSRKEKLRKFAKSIKNVKSEMWFLSFYKPHNKDQFNVPLGKYIPDIVNKKLHYVIEVDGSIHDRPFMKKKDQKKDTYYYLKGFKVFRVKAYNETELPSILEAIYEWRRHVTKNKPFNR